jgi:RNA polymerase sigma factor (TIGR02999 family)
VQDVTLLLQRLHDGDDTASEQLARSVYAELRRMAAQKMALEKPGQTIQPTCLIHEAWLRLGNGSFNNRAHFFSAAAEAIRRILVDRARRKQADKRGAGEAEHVPLEDVEIIAPPARDDETLAVHGALDALAARDPQKAQIVKLRYFVGLTFEEAAEVLGISVATARRGWAYARVWLQAHLMEQGAPCSPGG